MKSVCIPTFNGEKYIYTQLMSILCQLDDDDEVIISDDYSTDQTIPIIESINDPRIKIFYHEKCDNNFIGAYKNIYYVYRNVENALKHASGDYIFLSDQDDLWLPNKVSKVMSQFDDGADIILHNNTVVDENENVILDSYFKFSRPSYSKIRLFLRCYFQGASMAFKRQVHEASLPFPDLGLSHDHWIGYVAIFKGYRLDFIKEPLLLYRRHSSNVSSSSEKSKNPLWFKISYRVMLLKAILIIRFR